MTQEYDVFISFKNLKADGTPTRDSELATEVYEFLSKQGLSVFLSKVSLERLGIDQYKKAIDDALDAAHTLVAVGTTCENLNSQWVRYEWDSFYNDILSDIKPKGRVFAYVESVDSSSLPRALRQSQTFSNGPTSLADLYNFIANAVGQRKRPTNAVGDEAESTPEANSHRDVPAAKPGTFVVAEKSGTEHTLSQLCIAYPGGFGPSKETRGIKLKRGSAESLIEWSRIDTLTFVRSSKNTKGRYEYEVELQLHDGNQLTMNVAHDWNMQHPSGGIGLLSGQCPILGEVKINFCDIGKITRVVA